MSIIVSVKINDGMVLAADSATTFYTADGRPGQIYEHVNKIVNLIKGLPIGVMTCGAGSIGPASIATLLKDLRVQLSGDLQIETYTTETVASRVHAFFSEKAEECDFKGFLVLRICGYSAGHALPEMWDLVFSDGHCPGPRQAQSEAAIGVMWEGEHDALNRIIFGMGTVPPEAIADLGMSEEQADAAFRKLLPHLYENLILAAAPIQDAIDLARFLVETTKGFIRFGIRRVKTVGGPIEIAAITKHEGFRWVQRKLFFPPDLNVG